MPPVYGYFIDGLSFNMASCRVSMAMGTMAPDSYRDITIRSFILTDGYYFLPYLSINLSNNVSDNLNPLLTIFKIVLNTSVINPFLSAKRSIPIVPIISRLKDFAIFLPLTSSIISVEFFVSSASAIELASPLSTIFSIYNLLNIINAFSKY